jgi:LPXTG-motif cell wall-anchored protein
MRKVMLLAAMLAMVLAAAAPAFGQATAVEYGDDDESVNTAICNNVADVAVQQYNAGDQNAASVEGDASNIANELGISVNQVNECFNAGFVGVDDGFDKTVTATAAPNVDDDGDGAVDEGVDTETVVATEEGDTETVVATANAVDDDEDGAVDESGEVVVVEGDDEGSASAAAEESATAAAAGELPETGGASVLALGAGALLVIGGLVARRIVR